MPKRKAAQARTCCRSFARARASRRGPPEACDRLVGERHRGDARDVRRTEITVTEPARVEVYINGSIDASSMNAVIDQRGA
jgi:hypothetical protein